MAAPNDDEEPEDYLTQVSQEIITDPVPVIAGSQSEEKSSAGSVKQKNPASEIAISVRNTAL
jgi:hypothetical protein